MPVIRAAPHGQGGGRLAGPTLFAVPVPGDDWLGKLLLFVYILIFMRCSGFRQNEAVVCGGDGASPGPLGFLTEGKPFQGVTLTGHAHTYLKGDARDQGPGTGMLEQTGFLPGHSSDAWFEAQIQPGHTFY